MQYLLGTPAVVFFAVLSISIPIALRVLVSPLGIILITPFLLVVAFSTCLLFNIVVGRFLDARESKTRKHLFHAARPLSFSTPAAWQAVLTRSQWSHKSPHFLPPLYPDYPSLSTAINDILIMIVRDFVLVWYREISSSPSFPTAVSSTLHGSLEALLERATRLDVPSLMVRNILPKLTAHVEQFRQSETALRGAGLERHLTQSDELDLLLASRYTGKGGKLHPAVDNLSSMFTRQTEEVHLRQLVDRALPFILPHHDRRSKGVSIVAREIVACSVLAPLMELLADPDFWNRTIDQLAGAAIRQQKLISKVRNVLEAQSPAASLPQPSSSKPTSSEAITLRTDARHFESFLRSISHTNSLLDARRLKNDIIGEIRRTRTVLANHENDEWINGQKTEDVVAFLDRLYTAKRKVEKRISILGGQDDSRSSVYQESAAPPRLTLRDILTNPSSLSYFMEFMDRRGRSLLVQFWLTVESFKNPLESVDSDSSNEDEDPLSIPPSTATLKEDMSMINDLYFSGPAIPPALAAISKKHTETIRSYVVGSVIENPAQEKKVRRAVMLAQRQVEQDMDHDFEEFEQSDLWFRAVGDIEHKGRRPTLPPSPQRLQQRRVSNSSVGLLASLVQGLDPARNSKTQALPRSESSPMFHEVGSSKAQPIDLGRSTPNLAPPITNRAVSNPQSTNLEILMSSSTDIAPDPSRAPLFDDPDDKASLAANADEAQRMEAIQAAVTDIIANENRFAYHPRSSDSSSSLRRASFGGDYQPGATTQNRGMFDDVDDYVDETMRADDQRENTGHGTFQLAAPGDLQLSHEISRLGEKISNLQSQDVMLDTLIRKAELTGDAQELRLLQKSKSALGRELRQLTFQRTQYEQQESANRLVPGRTKVAIVNSTVGEEEGKSVVRYLIEVQQLAMDGSFASGWVVARRYNEFFIMHQCLRERYLMVKNLDFPGKRLVTHLSNNFVDARRVALEKYLQNLLSIPMVCESGELMAFLSRESPFMTASQPESSGKESSAYPGQKLVRTVYRTFTESIDDMFFGPSMLDVMIGRLTRQAAEFAGIVGTGVNDEDLVTQALKASGKSAPEETLLQLPGDLKPLEGETSTSSFSAPICDLILAVFELDKKNNWLRRQAIVIILQQVLGDTIERKLRDSISSLLDEPHLMTFVNIFKDSMWPGGQLKPPGSPRSADEKTRTREEANRKLTALLPDVAANMIGRSNARRGARRIFAVMQNRRLNQHIIYTILDEIFAALFPEASPLSGT
ncbi:hypothetical protein BD410DRAFT_782067 [Rickenella mellea]|uniref:PhoX domain-containing protein n=1 Tax=Rickenella mellea TaxID=50990 RepID=A0A4Y7QL12_9AGAM|nr:hypothetical protein BD410DRAFT_782067 [Rickenella mellea]